MGETMGGLRKGKVCWGNNGCANLIALLYPNEYSYLRRGSQTKHFSNWLSEIKDGKNPAHHPVGKWAG